MRKKIFRRSKATAAQPLLYQQQLVEAQRFLRRSAAGGVPEGVVASVSRVIDWGGEAGAPCRDGPTCSLRNLASLPKALPCDLSAGTVAGGDCDSGALKGVRAWGPVWRGK